MMNEFDNHIYLMFIVTTYNPRANIQGQYYTHKYKSFYGKI